MEKKAQKDIAMSVVIVSIIFNTALTALKLVAGVLAHSSAMISDAIHTATDVLSTFVVMIGISMSRKKADKCHPYGHERFECVAAIILAAMLLFTGLGIAYRGLQIILSGARGEFSIPGVFALVVAVISIVSKECMFRITKTAAKKVNSGALMADAWHHRSDALSSIGSFAGILGARIGFPIFDPIASVVISLFIIKAAYDIFVDAINKMADKSCDENTVQQISKLVLQQKGVKTLDLLNTRLFGSKVYVEVEIGVNKELTIEKAHDIAEEVHIEVEKNFGTVKHCMVHVNPANNV